MGDLAAHQRETEAEQEVAEEGVGATAVPAGEKDEDATAEVAGNAAERAAAGAGEQETSDAEEEASAEGDKGSKGQSVQAPHMAANTVEDEGKEGGSEAARNGDTGSGPSALGPGVVAAPAPVPSQDSAGSDDKKGTGIAALLSWSEQDKAKTFDAEGGGGGIAALTAAAGAGDTAEVARLVKHGSDIEGRHDGLSALLCAAGEGHASTVAWLLENKADVSATAPNGMTARVCSLPPRVCMPLALLFPNI